ncbi:spore coat protein U domain-containing protein [uncultured Pseudoalteromonas sp.]|uniref:spore coat protein U domain-containing protein n=1 Tax=uncultured Pseudoalteromonas sp. TaxID=114053 RepID=UPI002593FE13|nr:spore coat protein U domain-containing protein [uncultured Pseudoalteromonas sp.]
MNIISKLCCTAVMVFTCQQAYADCVVGGNSNQNLGAFSSASISTGIIETSFSSDFSCSGFVNLLNFSEIDATLVGADFQLTAANGDAVPYTLYTAPERSDPFTLNETVSFGSFNLLDLLGLFGDDGTIPIYLSTGTANVGVGTYNDTISILWQWDYCSGIGLLGICLGRDNGSATVMINVQLSVTESCSVQTSDVSLGTVSYLGSAHSAILPLDINCTKQLSYQYYVDGGDNFNAGQRNMAFNSETIAYKITTTDGNTLIGPDLSASVAGIGVGNNQAFQFLVETLVEDRFPLPGVYRDRVRVIVEF